MKLLLQNDLSSNETPQALDVRQNIVQLFAANDNFQPKQTDKASGREPWAQGNEPLVDGEVAA